MLSTRQYTTTGIVFLVLGIGLAVGAVVSQKAMRRAEVQALSFKDPYYVREERARTGKIPDDAKVEIQLFGPERRAADNARKIHRVIVWGASGAFVVGAAYLIVGLLQERRRKSNDRPEETA